MSTEEKAELSREAGADHVVLYTQASFVDAVKEKSGGKGLPVVYDSVAKTTFEDSLKCLRPRGVMALYGGSSGAAPVIDPIRLMTGSLYLTRPTLKDYVQTRDELESRANDVFGWVASGELKVRIGARYKLEDARPGTHRSRRPQDYRQGTADAVALTYEDDADFRLAASDLSDWSLASDRGPKYAYACAGGALHIRGLLKLPAG